MKICSLLAIAFAERSINDDEYQLPSEQALGPAAIHTLDRYEFEPGQGRGSNYSIKTDL